MALRQNRRKFPLHRTLETLESRLLLTASFSTDDVDLTWRYVGMQASGTVQLDNNNNVQAITFNTDAGTTIHPTGTYTVGSGGGFDMTLSIPANPGGSINSQRSAIALSEVEVDNSLALMINPASGATVANIVGSWGFYFNGDAADNSGLGTITFDGQGGIKSGSGKDSGGTTTITGGTYTVDNTGVVNVTLNVKQPNGQAGSLSLVGALNSTKDVIALNPVDMQDAATNGNTRMFVAVQHAGKFSLADVAGIWGLSSDGTDGSFLVDAAGNIDGSMTVAQTNGTFDLSGKITITSTGTVTLKINATQNNVTTPYTFTGTMSSSKDFMVANFVGGDGNNMTVFNHPNNHPPTLTSVTTIGTAKAGEAFAIDFDTLKTAANEADSDGDPLSFKLMSVTSGTLLVNNNPAGFFPFPIVDGDTITWTPDKTAKGKVPAFKIQAFDGSVESGTDVQVTVNVTAAPVITVAASKPKASELNNGTTTGVGVFTFTRSGSTADALDVDYSIDETGLHSSDNGSDYPSILNTTVHFDAGQKTVTVKIVPTDDVIDEGNETVTFVLQPGSNYVLGTKSTAVVTIADYEVAPASLESASFVATVTDGTAPFGDAPGKFTIVFGDDDTNYILFGQNTVTSSSGTFTWNRTSSTTGTITLDDTVLHNVTGTLTFSSPKKATFSFSDGGGGTQTGSGSFGISKQLAPANVDSRTISGKVLAGIAPAESSGNFNMTFSNGTTIYALTGTPATIRSHGGFNYSQFAPNCAIITTNDSVTTSTYALLFSSSTAASYIMSSDDGQGNTGAQAGTMKIGKAPTGNFSPASLRGLTIHATASGGVSPLKTSGAYTLVFDGGADTYTGTNGFANASSTGTDVYTRMSGVTALLDFNDTIAGQGFMILTFTSAHKATYYLVDVAGNTQKGTWTF